jgi:hypothetical protein
MRVAFKNDTGNAVVLNTCWDEKCHKKIDGDLVGDVYTIPEGRTTHGVTGPGDYVWVVRTKDGTTEGCLFAPYDRDAAGGGPGIEMNISDAVPCSKWHFKP